MKSFFLMLVLAWISLTYNIVLADEPDVQQNVHVLQNATVAQCQSASRGDAGPVDVQGYSGGGEYTGTSGPGVRSCTGCAVDAASGDCVCKMCYYFFN